ncbi:ester cyclase [Nocardia aurantia]|uniref:Aklanonic acid methyl ester cyclase DnrD n=1 Tax=Nocardia aurantia TaxID=2585199 RepID=A0A7K0DRJ9_9NOCA|nr:ester cyclase [Nocardia aurantia]MQY28395.1 Aklanonic acid methyl ester cyclase DnrD [Nocardia aurantia]
MGTVIENKATVEAFFETLNRGVADGSEQWVGYLSPRIVDHNKVIFGEADEPGAAVDGFRRQLAAFGPTDARDSGMLVQDLIGEGDRVVARLRVVGKHIGSHPRMPAPTGRDCDVEQIWILTVADGVITEIRAVSDRLGMFLQLGWDWPTVG